MVEANSAAANENVEGQEETKLEPIGGAGDLATGGEFQNVGDIPAFVMNEEVKEYEPTLEDIFFIIPSGDYQRLLFQGQDLREREETHLTDFRNFLQVKNY